MRIPRFILIAFLILVVAGTALATSQLVSNSAPQLGEPIVVTPVGTPPPTSPTVPTSPTASPSPSPTTATPTTKAPTPPPPSSAPTGPAPTESGAVVVPGCAPLAGNDDDDCDDWDDDWDDFDDD